MLELCLKEPHVEPCVVGYDDAVAQQRTNLGRDVLKDRCVRELGHRQAMDALGATEIAAGVDERFVFSLDFTVEPKEDNANFDNAVMVTRRQPRRFDVDSSESVVAEM